MNTIISRTNSLFGEVHFAENEGKILMCGIDVARALGYSDVKQALKRHIRREIKLIPTETKGGVQNLRYIQEGDVYRLIIRSKLPEATKFEAWVFDEVLPSIRQHGYYINSESRDRAEAIELVLSGYEQLQPSKASFLKKELIVSLKEQNTVLAAENRRLMRALKDMEQREAQYRGTVEEVKDQLLKRLLAGESF